MIKKAEIDLCIPKQQCNYNPVRRGSTKNIPENKVKTNGAVSKDKNTSVNISGEDADPILYDIDRLVEFIESKDEDVVAVKKAAKKARQKQKKEDARRIKEAEEAAKRRAEEERIRKEEDRLKTEMLAKEAALKKAAKKHRQRQQHQALLQSQTESKSKKKNENGNGGNNQEEYCVPEFLEETIPAMVTIKRIVENNNCPPTVTITLKGSTSDQDQLLYTLVNGNSNSVKETNRVDSKSSKKKNNKKVIDSVTTTNELKVTLSVDKSFRKELENKEISKKKEKKQQNNKQSTPTKDIIDIPSFKLPPGITITKINGPLTNKKSSNTSNSDYPNVPVNKSGDTEKLIQQSYSGKKNKKKKKSAQVNQQENIQPVQNKTKQAEQPAMVTLKNPIFHRNNAAPQNPLRPHVININKQATISRGANGMVTIQRPRHESPEFLSPVIKNPNSEPVVPESTKIIRPSSPRLTVNSITDSIDDNGDINNTFFLGLPEIQITKVNRQAPIEQDLSKQMANVSISCAGRGQFNLNIDDWSFGK